MFFRTRKKPKLSIESMAPAQPVVKLPPHVTNPETPLLMLSEHPEDAWTLGDAYEGTQIFGESGGGKTSGSGRALAHAFLRSGMGGIVLCAKLDEAETWLRNGEETGTSNRIIRFDASGDWRFNFLEYELNRNPADADIVLTNVVSMLMQILEVAQRGTGLAARQSSSDPFWEKSAKRFIGEAVRLLYATYGRVRLNELLELILSAPQTREEMQDEQWRNTSFFAKVFGEFFETGGGLNPPSLEDVQRLKHFWTRDLPNMPPNTRGNIVTTLQTDLDPLLQGRMRKIFSTETNLAPEVTHAGFVILLDFPVKLYDEAGILAQSIFKYLWQKAAERRRVDAQTRPIFYWADECQFFLSSYDMEFQGTARSSKACSVLLTQNLPSFYSRVGGQMPEHTVDAMLGNLRTKVFHSNSDIRTNEWASKLIGKRIVLRATHSRNQGGSSSHNDSWSTGYSENFGSSFSTTVNADNKASTTWGSTRGHGISENSSGSSSEGKNWGTSVSYAEQKDNIVDPEEFSRELRRGGRKNRYRVSGVFFQSGRTFKRNGKNFILTEFAQR